MKKCFLVLSMICFACITAHAQDTIEFDSNQSMCISGKGAGQDGAINPYLGEDCYAIVKNTGDDALSIRIQENGEITDMIEIQGKKTKKIFLKKNAVLYVDTDDVTNTVATFSFEAIKKD